MGAEKPNIAEIKRQAIEAGIQQNARMECFIQMVSGAHQASAALYAENAVLKHRLAEAEKEIAKLRAEKKPVEGSIAPPSNND